MKEKTYQPESRFHWYPSGTNLILIGSVPNLPTIDFFMLYQYFGGNPPNLFKPGILHLGLTLLAKAHRHIDSHQSCRATAGFPKFSRLQHCIWAQDGIPWWTQQFLYTQSCRKMPLWLAKLVQITSIFVGFMVCIYIYMRIYIYVYVHIHIQIYHDTFVFDMISWTGPTGFIDTAWEPAGDSAVSPAGCWADPLHLHLNCG
jgi:hypothetical protein